MRDRTVMTGDRVRTIRQRAAMDVPVLAALLGVSQSTFYRWEALGPRDTRAEGHPVALLEVLDRLCEEMSSAKARAFGRQLAELVRTSGALRALYELLGEHFRRQPYQRTRSPR